MAIDISKMHPYNSPVSPSLFPHLTIILLGIGLISTAYFFVNGVSWLIVLIAVEALLL
uniref:Dolichyl-diphosphooligosaccharide-protein glycosyltransferase subunit TMEM258 n=1 Tax=Meloidogyne incognita TaxID=6306 RepID=A0A914NYI0_MELIC